MSKEYTRIIGVQGNIPLGDRVIYYDDMEARLKWALSATGPDDAALTKDQSYVFTGDYSLRLQTRTTNAAQGDYAEASRWLGLSTGRGVALECGLLVPSSNTPDKVSFMLRSYDGNYRNDPTVYYDVTNAKWQYLDSANTVQDIPDADVGLYPSGWQWVRFSIDFPSVKYGTLWIAGKEYDLSSLSFYRTADTGGTGIRPTIRIVTPGAAMVEIWFDQFSLLTLSE